MTDLESVKDNNKENKMSSKKRKLYRGDELPPLTEEDLELAQRVADAQATPQVRNADNEYLGGPLVDHLTTITGQGGTEVPEFIPTRHELLQLVKYWEREDLFYKWRNFVTSSDGDADYVIAAFSSRRIARIAELLGEEEVKRAIDEAREEFSRRLDPRRWDIFLHGDKEQWRPVQEEMLQEHQEHQEQHERRLKEKGNLGA